MKQKIELAKSLAGMIFDLKNMNTENSLLIQFERASFVSRNYKDFIPQAEIIIKNYDRINNLPKL